ncbi:hypothetical protein HK102_003678 [Quaeritorhiza haematococci]|nr:hypothetical protein HK102_003678 [Quaeritorhiza haematococci]
MSFVPEEPPEHANLRFQIELEFVQCLANPQYLQFLAQQQYFNDEAFVNYLKYLKYWQRPEYAKFIIYPYCLELLELLQHPSFREAVASAETALFIHHKEFYHWQWYRNKRAGRLVEPADGSLGGSSAPDDIMKQLLLKRGIGDQPAVEMSSTAEEVGPAGTPHDNAGIVKMEA